MAIRFKLSENAYTPMGISYLKAATEREARAEYSRLRSIARKRVERIASSKDFSKSLLAKRKWKPLREMVDIGDLERGLADLRYFLQRPTTLKELRSDRTKKIRETLAAHGFEVAAEEIAAFGDFMEWARSSFIGLLYASDQIADLYQAARVRGLRVDDLKRDFGLWMDKRRDLEDMPVDISRSMSSREIRKYLGMPV